LSDPQFDLSPEDAVTQMQKNLDEMREDTLRDQLKDIDSDTAYELGYETALFDYRHLTGPNPLEIDIVEVAIPEENK